MAAATTTTPTRSCAAATAWCRWTSMYLAARRPPRRWSTASCSCRRRSDGQGRFCVAEETVPPPAPPTPADQLAAGVAALPGVTGARVLLGEVVADAGRDGLV